MSILDTKKNPVCLVSWTKGSKWTYTEGDNGIVNSQVVKIDIHRGMDYGHTPKYAGAGPCIALVVPSGQ